MAINDNYILTNDGKLILALDHSLNAAGIDILDSGGYFTGTEVETALQEIGAGTAIDHGLLQGLGDDDHTQYILHWLADAADDFLVASGADTFVRKTLAETGAILEGDIEHDNLQSIPANDHIDHSGVSVIAGTLLTGGGVITSDVTLNVDEATIDHGSIAGLGDDDHTIYVLVDGSRDMTGNLTITNAASPSLYVTDITTPVTGRFWADDDTVAIGATTNHGLELIANNSVLVLLDTSGGLYLSETTNTNMTVGITIQQGGNDDEILALKSSDVAHGGISGFVETDTYCSIRKTHAAAGGVNIIGLRDPDGSGGGAVLLDAWLGENADTAKTTIGRALCEVRGSQLSGSGIADVVADGNVFSVRARISSTSTTVFIVDEDGDTWQTGYITANGNTPGVFHRLDGLFLMGDDANTNMTVGLTINQGSNNDHILELKSSDVSHPHTDDAETDTFGFFEKQSNASGGLVIGGMTDSDSASAIRIKGFKGVDSSSTKGAISFYVFITDGGTGTDNLADDECTFRFNNESKEQLLIWGDGQLVLGNTVSTNTDIDGPGITIDQGNNDDQILAFKSSDVVHLNTDDVEADTFGFMQKASNTAGGLDIVGVRDPNGAAAAALKLTGVLSENADTTKSSSGRAICEVTVYQASGGARQDIVASGNILGVVCQKSSSDVTVWLLDEDGDTWQDGSIILENGEATFKASNDSAAVADEVTLGGYEIGAGNRVLAISQETVVAADVDETKFSNKLQVRINGATYYIMLTTT